MPPREAVIAHAAACREAIAAGKPRPAYNGPSLAGANLAGANLAGANLAGANLAGANLAGANLAGANLYGAYLAGAYLARANLYGAYLAGANLAGAYLAGAYLAGAYLAGANLAGAYLARADLARADLYGAYLDGANLDGATLPAPTVVLLASWGTLPDDLTRDLMRYDAACHPDPARFDAWAKGGSCPYDGVKVGRAAHFTERRSLWSPGPSERPYDLMVRVLAAKCPPWTEEQRAAFAARFTRNGEE
jgi:hypothetical protein